jgi:hypothetical protein
MTRDEIDTIDIVLCNPSPDMDRRSVDDLKRLARLGLCIVESGLRPIDFAIGNDARLDDLHDALAKELER